MPADVSASILAELTAVTGAAGITTGAAALEPHVTEWRGNYRGRTPVMVAPATTAEAAAIMRICHARQLGVVPQGGNTGLVGGAIPASTAEAPQIVLSARRLQAIRNLDADNYTITAEAGCLLADVQAAAAAADRFFPLSLAAEGSCQLGGNISTNAGGTNVLRYGNTRDLVLGLEVVLPDGRIYAGLRGLRKDNAGYDLKQLFIGAEGTLGFITAAICKLFPPPRSLSTAFVAIAEPAAAIALLSRARVALGDQLIAFELINRRAMDFVLDNLPEVRDPFAAAHPWYLLLELGSAGTGSAADEQLEAFLAEGLTTGQLIDGILAQSSAQRAGLWHLRHGISEAQKKAGAGIKHDISVPVSRIPEFLGAAGRVVAEQIPGVQVVAFGHLGDGNLHYNLNQPEAMDAGAFLALREPVSLAVHSIAVGLGGSFSAEHGVGVLKRADLARWRGGVELELMRTLKAALDPTGIMNPGKLLPDD
ncbi:MAG: FAD-binding oxidoreductase [Gammaproteobacteria bacterium]|nr:MAG: FAD-binding oxidoreductase [Gammaproteobacteria bacterium]